MSWGSERPGLEDGGGCGGISCRGTWLHRAKKIGDRRKAGIASQSLLSQSLSEQPLGSGWWWWWWCCLCLCLAFPKSCRDPLPCSGSVPGSIHTSHSSKKRGSQALCQSWESLPPAGHLHSFPKLDWLFYLSELVPSSEPCSFCLFTQPRKAETSSLETDIN